MEDDSGLRNGDESRAFGFFNFADSYMVAAKTVLDNQPKNLRFISPIRFLIWHAIELYLKAFLLSRGVPLADLKNAKEFGHDCQKLLTASSSKGLEAIPSLTTLVTTWRTDSVFESRYLETGPRRVPEIEGKLEIASVLRRQVGDHLVKDGRVSHIRELFER